MPIAALTACTFPMHKIVNDKHPTTNCIINGMMLWQIYLCALLVHRKLLYSKSTIGNAVQLI